MTPEIVLPNELSACHELIAELAATVAEQQAKLEAQRLEIDYLLKLAFRRRSERYLDNPDQLTLDLGEIPEVQDAVDGLKEALAEAQPDAEPQAAARSRKPPRKPRNEQLPAHLPRYEVTAEIPEEQRHCAEHGERVVIGYDRVETLEFTPPKLQVRVTLYPKLICVGAPQCGVQSPERKAGLVEGNRYDTSVAAEIITAKYGYHLPIYRQQDCFAESGWTPGRSTLLNIACGAAALALPLIRYFADCVRTDWGVGTDDTGVTLVFKSIPPIDPANPRSQRIHEVLTAAREKGEQSITAKMWVYRGMDVPLNVFDFTVSRHRDGPDEFLVDTDYTGTMMADCYSGYQKISLRSEGRLSRAACNSHSRRKVFNARDNHPLCACMLLGMYQELYDIEDRGKTLSHAARLELRQREAAPVWDRMRAYLDSDAVKSILPKDKMYEAIRYLNNHWEELRLYLTDGRLPIDNNETEQLMKQVALGRKNWLFVGSVAAGERAAVLMSLVSSAVRNDLDVTAYVKDVLDQLLAGSTDYESLRPDVWAAAHPEHIRVYRQEERRDRAERKEIRRFLRRQAREGVTEDPS